MIMYTLILQLFESNLQYTFYKDIINFYYKCTGSYWKTNGAENCPLGKVVVSEKECIFVSSNLGRVFIPMSKIQLAVFLTQVSVEFNAIINPSETSSIYQWNGGVC